jgi:hypothetical protein
MNKITLFFLLIFSSLILPVQAVELTQEFKTQDGFTMYLPDNCMQIPARHWSISKSTFLVPYNKYQKTLFSQGMFFIVTLHAFR